MTKATLIYNAHLLDETMNVPGSILIIDGKIRAVFQGYFTSSNTVSKLAHSIITEDGLEKDCKLELYDAHGLTVTPSFIDMHVHLRYPGQTQKEDLESGLHAAIAGGFGTVVAMPNTSPVVSSIDSALEIGKKAASLGLAHIFQVVSITKNFEGTDVSHLNMITPKYVPVISEDGHDVLSASVMLDGMKIAAAKNCVVSCHCEDPSLAMTARVHRQNALKMMNAAGLSAWGTSDEESDDDVEIITKIDKELTEANKLLAVAEDVATSRNIQLAKLAGCHIHLAHVSTKKSLEEIRNAKIDLYTSKTQNNTFSISCEVTPHHLGLSGTEEPYIRALVNPPLRSERDRIALIEGLRDGTVDVISTDHAPHTFADKAGGSPGFTGLETAYGVCNTVLVHENHLSPLRLSQLMSANPARILGLQKGLLKAGFDADLTLVDTDEEWIVDSNEFYSKGKATPFEGKKLFGKVHCVFIEGRKIYEI